MKLRISVFICILAELCLVSKGRYCFWSKQTVEKVKSCPVSFSDWEIRKKIKNCSFLAQKQNCTDVANFNYHCVINELENALIEVCAPDYQINGYCAEYNELGARIQLHYGLRCDEVKPPCPTVYPSTEAYKYPGCYDVVEKNLQNERNVSSKDITTIGSIISSTLWNANVTDTNQNTIGSDTNIGMIFGIVAVVIFIVTGTLCGVLVYWKSKARCKGFSICNRETDVEENDGKNNEMSTLLPTSNGTPQELERSYSVPMEGCEKCDFQYACAAGKLLLDMVRENDTNMNDRRKDNEEETKAFLEAYDTVNEIFEETKLTHKCMEQLQRTGLVVVVGKQGCGKTLTAVHIMKSKSYEGWMKRKFTSWEDLLAFDLNEKTIVYIDNIFDGYLYRHHLKKWWDTFCYFYFNFIKDKDSIRLLITAKDNVIENACAHMKANVPVLKRFFFVEEVNFPLSVKEMLSIVKKQVQLAEDINNISKPIVTESLVTSIKTGDIGFPLCAHLYAFENRDNVKGKWILDNPRAYVRNQIADEIEKDETSGVKTLFLILLIHHSQPGSNYKMDFRYSTSEECLSFLKEKCSESLVDEMKPLNFENLNERAMELEGKILIKHFSIYEFQHQIYLEGASDYFLRNHFEVAVQQFPLDILRTYEFEDISEKRLCILLNRLIQELFKNALSEALSCRIFERVECEQRFCKELLKEEKLKDLLYIPDKASPFSLPVIFWANKYGLKKLSKLFWNFVETNQETNQEGVHSQFYLARFGECCENDENYITHLSMPINVNDIRTAVCHFRFSGQKNILHLLISSDKSDDDAHRFMMKVINDSIDKNVVVDMDLLELALTNVKRSRLLCISEILFQLTERSRKEEKLPNSCLVEPLNTRPFDTFLELELGVRICIVLAYKKIHTLTYCIDTYFAKKSRHFKPLFKEGKIPQTEMARLIKKCIEECHKSLPTSSENSFDNKHVRFDGLICGELIEVVESSINVILQSRKDDIS